MQRLPVALAGRQNLSGLGQAPVLQGGNPYEPGQADLGGQARARC